MFYIVCVWTGLTRCSSLKSLAPLLVCFHAVKHIHVQEHDCFRLTYRQISSEEGNLQQVLHLNRRQRSATRLEVVADHSCPSSSPSTLSTVGHVLSESAPHRWQGISFRDEQIIWLQQGFFFLSPASIPFNVDPPPSLLPNCIWAFLLLRHEG